MVITICCPSCDAELGVQLDDAGCAVGLCEFCEEPIAVIDGEVYYPEDAEELRLW
jgi:hypothetical protein